jgi:hypothetical protein
VHPRAPPFTRADEVFGRGKDAAFGADAFAEEVEQGLQDVLGELPPAVLEAAPGAVVARDAPAASGFSASALAMSCIRSQTSEARPSSVRLGQKNRPLRDKPVWNFFRSRSGSFRAVSSRRPLRAG